MLQKKWEKHKMMHMSYVNMVVLSRITLPIIPKEEAIF
jgi:hypothetical protein